MNDAWYQMYNILLKAINRYAPLIQNKVRGRECPWLTNSLRKAMRERDSLLKDVRRSKSAFDWAAYKRKRNQVNNLLRNEKNSFIQKLLYDNRNNPKQFWKTIKRVYPNKPSTVNSSCAFNLNDDGIIIWETPFGRNWFRKYCLVIEFLIQFFALRKSVHLRYWKLWIS